MIFLGLFIGPTSIFPLGAKISQIILWQIRFPRVILGLLVGLMLATSGTILQGILRNPLADPYILGVSAGAGVGAAIAVVSGLWSPVSGLFAFLGALLAVFIVYRIAYVGGKTSPETLILSGVAVSAFAAALLSLIIILSGQLQSIYFWLLGGLSSATWDSVLSVIPYAVVGLIIVSFFSRDLNILLLGEESALSLGIEVEWVRKLLLAVASLMTAAAVSVSGLIGFVGLIVPHFVRLIVGPNHKILLPVSAISGAILLIACDILARMVLAPTEIPIGIITGMLGSPFFLYLLRRRRK